MEKFTELHLGNKTSQDHSSKGTGKGSTVRQKVLFGSGLLAVSVLSGVWLLITNGCSKGQKVAPMLSSPTSVQTTAAANTIAPVIAPAVAPTTPKKPARKRVERKAPVATYTDSIHGVSFRYPKNSVLKTGDEPNLDLAGMGPMQMDFVEPGGITVAAIELPRNFYPGTDFRSAFFSVSLHPEMTMSECEEFASPQGEHPESNSASPSSVKIGGMDLQMVEEFNGAKNGDRKEPSARYYHRFENGNCYEFGMGVATDDSNPGLKPVNREQVFHRLEQILATVRVEPGVVPEAGKYGPVHAAVEETRE
jgi:hypothetical protein